MRNYRVQKRTGRASTEVKEGEERSTGGARRKEGQQERETEARAQEERKRGLRIQEERRKEKQNLRLRRKNK